MSRVEVTRTNPELTDPGQLRASTELKEPARMERVHALPPSFVRYFYTEIGRDRRWTDRADWSDERWHERRTEGGITFSILYEAGAPGFLRAPRRGRRPRRNRPRRFREETYPNGGM